MCSPADLQVELVRRADRRADQDRCVGRISKRNMCQLVHPHSRGNGYRRHLDDVHRSLADNVAAQYLAGLAIDDQFAKAELAPVDDIARRRVEVDNCSHDIVGRTCLCFGGTP